MTPMKRTTRVAIGTCRELPEPDPDEALLTGALAAAGVRAQLLAWDDPAGVVGHGRLGGCGTEAGRSDCGGFDLCLLRSTWNYYEQPEAFLGWVSRVEAATRLRNPGELVRWNLHKRYLLELERAGVSIVPTDLVLRGGDARLEEIVRRRGWGAVVIKPAIGAASFGTRRFGADERAAAADYLVELSGERDVLIQPFLGSTLDRGELAIVWMDGMLTHAVCKQPRFAGGQERVSDAAPIGEAEREVAERAIEYVRSEVCADLLYGRVDVMWNERGGACVSEVELIEPSLFLSQHPPALDRLVAAVRRLSPPK